MRDKIINYDRLFVAFQIYDNLEEVEPYKPYVSDGMMRHHIMVSPKRVLVYSQIDPAGFTRYYLYETDEEIRPQNFKCSYEAVPSYFTRLFCYYMNGKVGFPDNETYNTVRSMHYRYQKTFGYFIPFGEYMEKGLGISIDFLVPEMVHKLLKLMNVGVGEPFELSTDPEIARQQLEEKLGFQFGESKKVEL